MGKTNSGRRGKTIEVVMAALIRVLRKGGATKTELVRGVGGTSPQTVQKALRRLREHHDAPIEFDDQTRKWVLHDPEFALPLDSPEPEDVVAVMLAEVVVAPHADEALRARLRRLVEQLDMRMRSRVGGRRSPQRTPMSVSVSLGTTVDPRVLRTVLEAVRRSVLRIQYRSPWKNELERVTIEPWQVHSHDGAVYLRAWCREAAGARTYRLVHIEDVKHVAAGVPTVPVPVGEKVWGNDGHPAYGIDHDRPGEAVIVFRDEIARWVHGVLWHPRQQDRWITAGTRLERRLPFRSCREIARRVLSVIDGVESIAPPELAAEVDKYVQAWLDAKRRSE